MPTQQPSFTVLSGDAIARAIPALRPAIMEAVRTTYLQHKEHFTNNPDSYFLRFPDKPEARIIALPCAIASEDPIAGIKWIASYPNNIKQNLQRASAVLILNNYATGFPEACLEAGQISAARTAASAVLGAEALAGGKQKHPRISFIGAGVISRTILDYFIASEWNVDAISIHDLDAASMQSLKKYAQSKGLRASTTLSLATCISESDIVVFATNAGTPYVTDESLFRPGQVVLNISLRDLSPEIIVKSFNIFDDVDHCMKANTSPHLAEQMLGNRSFCNGTLADILLEPRRVDRTKPLIFSPFGLGVLDLAVGRLLLRDATRRGAARVIANFFSDPSRW
jgi:N-[(2S)-2-amino-2-carboxyethyl]-L-glutamate dehydrogenase